MNEKTDNQLMELVKQSDFSAFDELFTRYSHRVRSFLFKLCWDPDTADDWTQDVFYRLWKARSTYEPKSKLSTYLLQIAKNLYISQIRLRRVKSQSFDAQNPDGYKPFLHIRANARMEPEVHLLEEYRKYLIRQAIQSLSDGQRLVFVMAHLEDMPYSEISLILGIPEGTVKSRLNAAVNKLRKLLATNGF